MSFRLHNFWWLLIWMFLAGGFCYFFVPQQEEEVLGRRVVRWNFLPALLTMLPYVFWAGWRGNGYGDTVMYRSRFNNVPAGLSNAFSYALSRSKDQGYAFFEVFFKSIVSHSDIAFFFFIAAVQILCLVIVYRKYSCNYWLSMFYFIASTDYIAWMHNGMRQFIAVALVFACLPLLVKRQYIPVILVTLLASRIHITALVFLPFIFIVNGKAWNLRTIGFIVVLVVAIYYLDTVTDFIEEAVDDTVYEADAKQLSDGVGTNIFRVLFYSVPAILSLIFRRFIDEADDPFINTCVNLSVVAAAFYVFSFFTSGAIAGRIPIYFSLANYILLPWLISAVFEAASAVLINSFFVAVYCVFFYYQMGPTWGLL